MSRDRTAIAGFMVVAVLLLAALFSTADARPHRVNQIPNGTVNGCANCHVNPAGGGSRNALGQAVEGSFLVNGDVQWAAALATLDSDGDGATNGAELQDPNGVWRSGQSSPGDATLVTKPWDSTSKPAPAQQGPTPDLDGDGNIGFSDFIKLAQDFSLGALEDDPGYVSAVDLQPDGRIGFGDFLVFVKNFGKTADGVDLALPADPGTNVDATVTMDLETGNDIDDAQVSGVVEGAGEVVSVDLFIYDVTTPLVGAHIVFGLDPEKLIVSTFTQAPGSGMAILGKSDRSIVLNSLSGATYGDNAWLGTVTFRALVDLTNVPFTIGLDRVVVAEAGALTNPLDVEGVAVDLNGGGEPGPGPGEEGPLLTALRSAETQLSDSDLEQIGIDPLLASLPDDGLRERLRGFAGEDLMLNMDEVLAAIEEIAGGEDPGPGSGPSELVSEVTRVELEEEVLCVRGPVVRVPGPDVEVEFPDGRIIPLGEAVRSDALPPHVRVALDVDRSQEGPPVVLSARVLGEDEVPEADPAVIVGRIVEANIQEGLVRLNDRCFQVTDESELVDDAGSEVFLDDLKPGDVVRVAYGEPQSDGAFRTATTVELLEGAVVQDVHIPEVRIGDVDLEQYRFVLDIEPPPGEPRVVVDFEDATIRDPENRVVDVEDIRPGSIVSIVGETNVPGFITAYEIRVLRFEGVAPLRGSVLAIEPPGEGRPGLLSITGPVFEFDEFGTLVEGAFGGRIGVRDLRPGVVIFLVAEPPEEEGRPERVVHIKVIPPGEPPPPPSPGVFVGDIGGLDFENSRIQMAVKIGFGPQTEFVGQNEEPIDHNMIQPGTQVGIRPVDTEFGLRAARVKVLRGANDLPPEKIATATFLIDGQPVSIKNASDVPLTVTAQIEFDRPLTEGSLDAVEFYVYSIGEDGEDVDPDGQIDQGKMLLYLTLEDDTIYEVFMILENGAEYFAQFTTGASLPSLDVVSVSPEDGESNVATETTLSITFNRIVSSFDGGPDVDLFILPVPESGEVEPEDWSLSSDGLTVSADLSLRADQTYLVVIHNAWSEDGFEMANLEKHRFSTGQLGTARVGYRWQNPPEVFLGPDPRQWTGFVYLYPTDVDFENLEGDGPERFGVAFDVSGGGVQAEITGLAAGSYFVEGFVHVEEGPGGQPQGVIGTYQDENGDPKVLEIGEGETFGPIDMVMANELRLTDSKPRPGQGAVSSGSTTISLQFSEPLRRNRGIWALEGFIEPPIPNFEFRRDLLASSQDPRRLSASVKLTSDTDYMLVVAYAQGVSGAELFDVIEIPFSTRQQFVAGSIAGTITTSDGSEPKGTVILADVESERRVGEVTIRRDVGTYEFKNVPEGTFNVFAKLDVEDVGTVRGFLDEDGDGIPDQVILAGGEDVADKDLVLTIPTAPTPGDPGENTGVSFSFDFDDAAGDGGVTTGQVNAGEEFSVAVYTSDVASLVGYEVLVSYDTLKVAAQIVEEGGDTEGSNVLRENGGLAAFIGRIDEGTVNLAAAILGPTETSAVSGEGLLGTIQFVALETFTDETELTVSSATMQGLEAADEVTSDAKGTVSAVELSYSIGLSVSPSIITADGSDSAKVTAQILDLNGVLQDDDSTTQVTFRVSSGTGSLSLATATVDSGVATTTVTASTSGTITIEASTTGAKSTTVSVVAEATGGTVPTGPRGPLALDMDTTAGDQEKQALGSVPTIGDDVTVDVVITEDAEGSLGISFELKYDDSALSFESFSTSDVYSGGLAITVPKTGAVEISIALLGSTASKDAGSVGQAKFKVTDGFATSSNVILSSGQLGTASGATTELVIGSGGATAVIGAGGGGSSAGPNPDFNGDGSINFVDFIAFAMVYGKNLGDTGYDAIYDLDENDNIGFTDFIQFAKVYGTSASQRGGLAKPLGRLSPGVNADAAIGLASGLGGREDEVVVNVGITDAVGVEGYSLTLRYDTAAFAWLGADGAAPSRITPNGSVALIREASAGEITLADVLDEGATIVGEGNLVLLRFRVLDPTKSGQVEIAEAMVSDASGRVNGLLGVLSDVRALPDAFALGQNYPNPFNPETLVQYQMPEAADVSLVIYNLLGQEVRVLVQERQDAGFYRVVWDGRDARGRSVSSGVYLTRMASGSFSSVRKMLMLK